MFHTEHHRSYRNQGRSHELDGPNQGHEPDIDKFWEFMMAKVTELCTGNGDKGRFGPRLRISSPRWTVSGRNQAPSTIM